MLTNLIDMLVVPTSIEMLIKRRVEEDLVRTAVSSLFFPHLARLADM